MYRGELDMILYHGSNVVVKEPQIIKSKRLLDFGTAFYLTSDFEQAKKWAVRTAARRAEGVPTISVFSINENEIEKLHSLHGGVVEACRQILDCKPRLTDVGVANGRYFVNVFSFGVFTNVSQHTPTHLKNLIGKAAYVVGGAVDFVTMHTIPLEIRSDDGDWDGNALIALAFNGRTAGNFPLARMAEVDDGMLDVLILKAGAVPALTAVPTFLQCIIGANNTLPRDVLHFRCSRMTISSTRDEHTDIDGQPGPALPVELECRAGALRVLRP